jgi:hypothetical protein
VIRLFVQAPVAAEEVRAKIGEVLARPEFQSQGNPLTRWLSEVGARIARAISEFFGISASAGGQVLAGIVYVGLGVALVLVVRAIVRAYARRRAQPDDEHGDPIAARAERVRDLRRRARDAERAGDLVLALRLYFTALVVGLGEKGDLEYRDAWTNRELYERGAPRPGVKRLLGPLVPALDARSFGREPAVPDDVAELARLCDEHLGALRS